MRMNEKMKRLLSLLLALVMILGNLPAGHVHAASNVDGGLEGQTADVFTALGFDTTVKPEGYDPDTVDNPYGRTKVTGTQTWEALVSNDDGVATVGSGNGSTNNNLGASSIANAGTSGTMPLRMFASAAADFDNDGLMGEAVYVGFNSFLDAEFSTKSLMMYIYNAKTSTFSDALDLGYIHNGQMSGQSDFGDRYEDYAYMYAAQNMLQVTAGDYDGDGVYEIAVYVGAFNNARVDIYKWMQDASSEEDDWMQAGNWSVVWSYVLSNTSTPNMVSLHSADINQDGMDDLSISYGDVRDNLDYYLGGLNSTSNDTATKSTSVILWGDRNKMLQSSYTLNLEAVGLGQLARVSVTTGDLDADGYSEIVVTGQPLNDVFKNTSRSIIVYSYDGTGGLAKVYADTFKIVDGYYSEGEWVSNNGFDRYYYSEPLMKTNAAVFTPEGYDYSYIYLDSCLYEYVEGVLTLKMCLDDAKYDNSNTLNNTWLSDDYYAEFGAVSMDINGEGYQKLASSYYAADSAFSAIKTSEYGLPTLTYDVKGGISSMEGKDGTLQAYTKSESYYVPEAEYLGTYEWEAPETMCPHYVTAVNCDLDTVILEYTGNHWLSYTDPEVLAVIAAAPYFEDVDVICDYDYAWQNTTSWSKTEGGGHGTTVQVDLEAGAYVSQGSKFNELETAALFTMEWVEESSTITEYTLTFETSQDEDAVAFFSIPTEHYEYTIYAPNNLGVYETDYYVVSRPFQAVYQILTLDYYESIRSGYDNLPAIRGEILTSTPGDPASYPASTSGYDVITKWNDDPAGAGFGNGSITQEITVTTEDVESYNLGAAVDFQAGGGYDGTFASIMAGATFSINPSGGWMDYEISGTTISGTVTNMPLEFQDYGYYYDWALFSYAANIGGSQVPIVSYIVNNVSEPPKLPDDFQQDVERTTADKNVLTWTYEGEYSKFIIYKYFDFPVGGGLEPVAEFAMGETPYILQYDAKGNPYKEYYFEDLNLAPYSEYQYAIQVERLKETPPLSAPSGLLTARTKAASGNPIITIAESDGKNDGEATVYPDKNSYLIAQVTGPDGEKGAAYYSTIQYQWQKMNDEGKWEDMVNEINQTLTIASAGSSTAGAYRCRVNVLTKSDNTAISAYSPKVELAHSKRSSLIEEAYAADLAGNVKLYAKVVNGHSDSGATPEGYVTFIFVNTSTGATYPVNVTLDTAGVATVISNNALPEGQYRVSVTYSGSYTFKGCSTEIYYLAQQSAGYSIEAPESVVYGNTTDIRFQKHIKTGGVTLSEPMDPASIVLQIPRQIPGGEHLEVEPGETPTEEQLNGAILIESGDRVEAGKDYCIYSRAAGAPIGVYSRFTAEYSGIYQANYYLGWRGFNIFRNVILEEWELIKGSGAGVYSIPDDIPANEYPRGYVIEATASDGTLVNAEITVMPRPITLQLPNVVKKQDAGAVMGDITYGELSVYSGSWASCDCDGDGNITGTIAASSVEPSYINTAGSRYDKDSALDTCGYYTVDAGGTLANYAVTYRTGSVSVIGGNKPITFGVRPFEGQSVGTLYMVSPDYAYTREETGITMSQAVGSRIVFTAAPDEGYQVYDWYVDGVAQGITDTRFAYVMLNQEAKVEVQFVFKPDTLVYGITGATEGGTLACSDNGLTSGSIVIPNTYLTFTAQAKEGYHFKEWRYTELGKGTAYYTEDDSKMSSTFELLMPKTSCSLYAVFERDGYKLTYTDKAGIGGLTAWYWGSLTGDTTTELEKITVNSGDSVPGDTQIVIQAKDGYALDENYNFVASGNQGAADYQKGTYTLILTEDTEITGHTVRNNFDVTVDFEIGTNYAFCEAAQVVLTVDGTEYTYDVPDDDTSFTVSDIPGGSKVSVSVSYPDYYSLKGWDVNGTLKAFAAYAIAELGEDTTFTLKLEEKPVYTVTLADITGKGSYSVTLPEGAGQSENVITCHENDPLTIQVIPAGGYTVTYWKVDAADDAGSWETKASSLKYQFPMLTDDYTFTPVFSGTTYHTVSWPTLRYFNVTLKTQEGFLSTVSSGESFAFTLSGGEDQYEYVLVNGRRFYSADIKGTDYPYRYEDLNGVRIYTISNITADQEITVSMEVPVYGVNVTPAQATVPAGKTVTLKAESYGINTDVYTWSIYDDGGNQTILQQGPSDTFTYTAPMTPGETVTITLQAGNSDNGIQYAIVDTNVTITVADSVKGIDITTEDLTVSGDGSYLVHPITPTGEIGTYDFDALVTMYSGKTNADVTWSVWGAQMRSTAIDADGILTVSDKEYGTNGQLKVIATHIYENGDADKQEIFINLSTDAYVATEVVRGIHGSISQVGYVEGGSTVNITATPDENHAVAGWTINGVAVADNTADTLSFTAEEMTHYSVTVEFTHYYPEAKHDEVNHWYECSCGDRTDVEEHYDFDKNHLCDKCDYRMSECADDDKDHFCDWCGTKLTECADENKDHFCDWCGTKLTECADDNTDHICDWCGETLSQCADANNNHFCDYCKKKLSECEDDSWDHNCDICGRKLSECADENADHDCDVCSAPLSECADEDKDHACDICGEPFSECKDENADHDCDICGKENITACVDEDPADHACDICGETLTECADDDHDHNCDTCGETLTDCTDENKDHNCDICGETLSDCADESKDHLCDICGKELSECADEDKDHKCDLCGKTLSLCTDEQTVDEAGHTDHICDICGAHMSACADEDTDGICDICGKELGAHDCADGNSDHRCDICGEQVSECKDENNDHKCDSCGKKMTECADTDNDHLCDTCGEQVSECVDQAEADHICDICGKELGKCADTNPADHFCDVCGETMGTCADEEPKDHHCDICGKELSQCTDEDKNHVCDVCGQTQSVCRDEADQETGLADHKCDICGETVSVCLDEDKNHNCDICGTGLGTCADENKDHICDHCGGILSACVDAADEETGYADHICDICGNVLDACKDEADEETGFVDHKCDVCGKVLTQCVDEAEPVDQICDLCGADMHECTDEETIDEAGHTDHLCDTCGYQLTQCLDEEVDEDGNTDHICDICGEESSLCVDEEEDDQGHRDHLCDICGEQITECVDADDHLCDICGEKISQCADVDHDDVCDLCGAETNVHADEDGDHRCDVCYLPLSECDDKNSDHLCDLCGVVWSVCKDEDKDHACDICGGNVGVHAPAEGNHICEYCGKPFSDCADNDGDHHCDQCGEELTKCADTDNDHLCDICGKELSECADEDKDHLCDICGEKLTECVDDSMDHNCDICGEELSKCADLDGDHHCDLCGADLGECKDENKDHICDIGGEKLTECIDEDKDHVCDICSVTVSVCADEDKDHLCDVCGKTISVCTDDDNNHICDICQEDLGDCKDDNKDHLCDYCDVELTKCGDEDKDHFCDICGKELSKCADTDKDHLCNYCGKAVTECVDSNGDHICDVCGTFLGDCRDDNKDHLCDACGKKLTDCTDENSDHVCDICGKELSACQDEDQDGICDGCGEEMEAKDIVIRIAGANRFKTAFKVADELKQTLGVEKFQAVIIASGTNFADALSGSYLASVKNAPMLLTLGDTMNAELHDYIEKNLVRGGTVYILGGTNAVPNTLDVMMESYNVVRLAGENRFETNLLILEEAGVRAGQDILVCTGLNFADSLSASALKRPILLVNKTLSMEQKQFLAGASGKLYIIGGTSAVSQALEDELAAYGQLTRLGGATRYETSVLMAQTFFDSATHAVLVYAANFPDGLSGGALASSLNAPLILTDSKRNAAAAGYAVSEKIGSGYVLGGTGLINDEAVRNIFAMTPQEIILVR